MWAKMFFWMMWVVYQQLVCTSLIVKEVSTSSHETIFNFKEDPSFGEIWEQLEISLK